jgi:squalene-associated FAD-dependent desaturase
MKPVSPLSQAPIPRGATLEKSKGRSVAIIGGGWAGLTAALKTRADGHHPELFEMAPNLGGRARSNGVDTAPGGEPSASSDAYTLRLDNGQHILIGAYSRTLFWMRWLGQDSDRAFMRTPLALVKPSGGGLRLPRGNPTIAFAQACLRVREWPLHNRVALLAWAARQRWHGFQCEPQVSVQQLCKGLAPAVQRDLIEPLCVAALNTPAERASASVFLRVLRDALLDGPGSSDLLLPRLPLARLFPEPAQRWLEQRGVAIHKPHRVNSIEATPQGAWKVDGKAFDAAILACSSKEASRLVRAINPHWAAQADALRFEPIVTAYYRTATTPSSWPFPMLMLQADDREFPAQFVFNHEAISGQGGVIAAVVSGAGPWVERGQSETDRALQRQLSMHLPQASDMKLLAQITEKRATFSCEVGLLRPDAAIARNLFAAGDYVDGPYPATLEGAVRSGEFAATQIA